MAKSTAGKESASSASIERRRSRRRPILDTFSLFIVVPKKGVHRLTVHDISDLGIGFDLDTEGEAPAEFPLGPGEKVDLRLYLNQSLYLPLAVEVIRIEDRQQVRRVGAEFSQREDKAYRAFLSFLQMLDGILDVAKVDESA